MLAVLATATTTLTLSDYTLGASPPDDTSPPCDEAAPSDEAAPQHEGPAPEVIRNIGAAILASQTTTTIAAPPTTTSLATFEGSGFSVVDLAAAGVTDQASLVEVTHEGSSNFVVWEVNDALEETNLLVNVIGPYFGRRVMNLDDDTDTAYLQIEADGAWTVDVYPLAAAGPCAQRGWFRSWEPA
jgi:hypothetical protein